MYLYVTVKFPQSCRQWVLDSRGVLERVGEWEGEVDTVPPSTRSLKDGPERYLVSNTSQGAKVKRLSWPLTFTSLSDGHETRIFQDSVFEPRKEVGGATLSARYQ